MFGAWEDDAGMGVSDVMLFSLIFDENSVILFEE